MLLGCDLAQLDDFTLGLPTNDEMLAIHQDPLGCQAWPVVADPSGRHVLAKPLVDGSLAVGLFNTAACDLRSAQRPSSNGYPDVDTYRTLDFAVELRPPPLR